MTDIDDVRALLQAKARPVGWAERRARLDEVGTVVPVADDIAVRPDELDGVPVEWSDAPDADATRVLLYFHGGGYCSGSITSHRSLVTEAGRAAGIRTLAVGYRLAPEHPYPAAVDDAVAVWRQLRSAGIAAERIAVAGDSAGAGVSLALWQRLRASGEQTPGCLWLVSPWTDLTISGPSIEEEDAIDPLIHRGYLEELSQAYAPDAALRRDPLVSPLFADLTGLPPTLIQVGTAETLLDDAVRLTRAAAIADAAVTLQTWPHMIHAFPVWNGMLGEGRRALAEAGRFIASRTGSPRAAG